MTGNESSQQLGLQTGERFQALHALYDNKQQWVRHYETLLAHLTPLSTTASLVISAYIADNADTLAYAKWSLLVPLVLSLFALWFTWWCSAEIKRQFKQIVTAEIGMCFYDIEVDGEPVLPSVYKESPIKTRPIVVAGYLSQAVSLTAVLAVMLLVGK